MSNAQCAHSRVVYNPIVNADGTRSSRWTCVGCDSEFQPLIPRPGLPRMTREESERPVWFCPRCLASEEDGSWGGSVDENFCSNCSASGSGIRVPLWAVRSIREQASWVGKRFYPHTEDGDLARERAALRDAMQTFPGRAARPIEGSPGEWWVDQYTDTGSRHSVMVTAPDEQAALAYARTRLPWFPNPKLPETTS